MTAKESPDPFETDRIEAVAAEFEVDAARLADLVESHQTLVDRLPGAENLVYEWRKQFGASVLARTEAWYFVDAPEWVWEEFADDLSAVGDELAALAAVHERTVWNHPEVSIERHDGTTPIVLLRT